MTRNLSRAIAAAVFCLGLGAAAPTTAPLPPRPPVVPPVAPVAMPRAQPACIPTNSADYVPGVGVNGRPVLPADLASGPDIGVSTEILIEPRTRTPGTRGVGVIANVPGLRTLPACPPAPSPRR